MSNIIVRYKCFYMWFTLTFEGMSRVDIAKKIKVSKQLVSHWSTGRQKPSLDSLHKLCFESGVFENEQDAKDGFDAAILAIINDIKLAKFQLTGDI